MFRNTLLAAVATMMLLATATQAQETTILGPGADLFAGYESRESQTQGGCHLTLYGTPQYTPVDVYVAEGDEIMSAHRPNAFVITCSEGSPKMGLRHIRMS